MTTNPAPHGDEADAAVTAGLRALSQSYPDMPSQVAERLERTLAELPELTAPDTAPAPAPKPKQPWWRRRYALASASLAVAAFVAGGILIAQFTPMNSDAATNAEGNSESSVQPFDKERDNPGENDQSEKDSGTDSEGSAYRVSYSGTDYSESDLARARGLSATGDKAALDPALEPLSTDKSVRDACLSELTGTYGGSVESVDFGQYEGEPAMVAVVADESSGGTVAAVGPDCRSGDPQVLGSAKF